MQPDLLLLTIGLHLKPCLLCFQPKLDLRKILNIKARKIDLNLDFFSSKLLLMELPFNLITKLVKGTHLYMMKYYTVKYYVFQRFTFDIFPSIMWYFANKISSFSIIGIKIQRVGE